MFEPLEERRLFHTFILSHGLLTLITHPDSETIGLRVIGPSYLATIDEEGVAESFPVAKVKRVLIQSLQGDDSININPDVNVPMTIQAGDGNDTVFAGAGPTVLEGDDGNDSLVDGGGADTFIGGTGNDVADFSTRTDALNISLDDVANDGAPNQGDNVRSDIETVIGGSGNDRMSGSPLADVLMGNGGKDTLVGLGGDDTLSGGSGNDRLIGGPGADFLVGSAGRADVADYEDHTDAITLSLDGQANDGSVGEGDNIAGFIENIVCGLGNTIVTGNGHANKILGQGGNDSLVGGGGNDTLVGGLGSDTLQGQGGDDVLDSADGLADTVSGGSGHDKLTSDALLDVVDTVP